MFARLIDRSRRYGEAINNYDVLKFAAIVLMTVDHLGHYFFPDDLWWRAIGRLCVPLWFFWAGHARKRFADRELIILALLMMVAAPLTFQPLFPLNALFTILLCRLALQSERLEQYLVRRPLDLALLCLVLSPFTYFIVEYGTLALLFAMMGRLVREGKKGKEYDLFYAFSAAAFIGWQFVTFDFSWAEGLFMAAGVACIVAGLSRFTIRSLPGHWKEGGAKSAFRLLARNSLYYYVLHRVAFQLIAGWMLVSQPIAFRWF